MRERENESKRERERVRDRESEREIERERERDAPSRAALAAVHLAYNNIDIHADREQAAVRAENAEGTPAQSYISPGRLVYEDKIRLTAAFSVRPRAGREQAAGCDMFGRKVDSSFRSGLGPLGPAYSRPA